MKLDFDTIEFWTNIVPQDKKTLTAQMFSLFPQVVGSRSGKYNLVALWLLKNKMIIIPNFRDVFSAGGRVEKNLFNNKILVSAALHRLEEYTSEIKKYLQNNDNIHEIRSVWNKEDLEGKQTLSFWKKLVIREIQHDFNNKSITAEEFINSII